MTTQIEDGNRSIVSQFNSLEPENKKALQEEIARVLCEMKHPGY
jgi:uncharacterized protein (UPF0335 family)